MDVVRCLFQKSAYRAVAGPFRFSDDGNQSRNVRGVIGRGREVVELIGDFFALLIELVQRDSLPFQDGRLH